MNKGKNVTNQDKAGFLQKYAIYSNTELFFVLFLYNYCAFAGVLGGFFLFFFPPPRNFKSNSGKMFLHRPQQKTMKRLNALLG